MHSESHQIFEGNGYFSRSNGHFITDNEYVLYQDYGYTEKTMNDGAGGITHEKALIKINQEEKLKKNQRSL